MNIPSLAQLSEMDAADIGHAIIKAVALDLARHGNSREPVWIARSLTEQTGNIATAQLFMEGIQFLIRAGLLIPDVTSGGDRYRLSRAGKAAAEADDAPAGALSVEDACSLLHPLIALAALGDFERGRERYDNAVFSAFKEVEIVVRQQANLGEDRAENDLFNAALGCHKANSRGSLTPAPMNPGEANGLRNLFSGAYAAFRNPAAHRSVGHSARDTMRLLILASSLVEIAERLGDNERKKAVPTSA